MKTKSLAASVFATLALTLLPMAAVANCPVKDKSAMSCPSGQQFDPATHKCTTVTG